MQWNDAYNEQIFCYTNNVHNKDGGTHLTGLRTALTRTINNYGQAHNLFKDLKNGLSGEDMREGVICVVRVKHPDPSFDSQTKSKLVSSEVKGIVESVVGEQARRVLRGEPADARKKIIDKTVMAAQGARGGAQGARDGAAQGRARRDAALPASSPTARARTRRRASCTSSRVTAPAAAPSRGATAQFQAILPLRGKILNVERARLEKMLSSAEIGTLITALGCGVDGERQLRHREAALPPHHPDDGRRRRRQRTSARCC